MGRATQQALHGAGPAPISIHALRGEGDVVISVLKCAKLYFNPRPPWGGRQLPTNQKDTKTKISIHALRGEGDGRPAVTGRPNDVISIHALRGEGDDLLRVKQARQCHFNPRPPWGGRRWSYDDSIVDINISIHALRGEGDSYRLRKDKIFGISIHALREEGDNNYNGHYNDRY